MLNKYKKDLNIFEGKNLDTRLLSLLMDLTNHSEGIWDTFEIRYSTVMTKTDWNKYSSSKEKAPYTTIIKSLANKPYEEIFEYIIELLKEVFTYYKSLKSSPYKSELKSAISTLLDCAVNARYAEETMREADNYVGRTKEQRDRGIVEITPFKLAKYEYALEQYCKYAHKNAKVLRKKILKACQDNYFKLGELLQTCDIDKEFRKDLFEISKIMAQDHTLEFQEVKRGWEIWKLYREIGIDVDEYLELNGLVKFSLIKKRLLKFMENTKYTKELVEHMKDELPRSYKKYIEQGYIDLIEMYYENAKRKKYPEKLRTDREVQKMIKEVEKEVYSYLPLAKVLSPRDTILNPVHPAATGRAFNSSIKNQNKKLINTIVMTPRTSTKEDYLPTFAHEVTHALHRKILHMGENAKLLKPGTLEAVPSAVMEEFSQLVEAQFDTGESLPYKKKYAGKEFTNFWSGMGVRYQVPYSLSQLSIRKEFDKLINEGYTGDLTDVMLWDLKHKYDALVKQWDNLGLEINNHELTAFNLFDACSPDDGTVYMKRYIVHEKDTNKSKNKPKKSITVPDAFEKRWGKIWIEKEEAVIMLHWLLLETGRNEKTEQYYKYILKKPISECIEELKLIGLTKKDIF